MTFHQQCVGSYWKEYVHDDVFNFLLSRASSHPAQLACAGNRELEKWLRR
jgi:hypothetical protein